MQESEAQYAFDRLTQLRSEFQVYLIPDWGFGSSTTSDSWRAGSWVPEELDRLYDTLLLLSNAAGGRERLVESLGGVRVEKSDIGSHAGQALAHKVTFAKKGSFSAWTVVHEFAHAWDANFGWKLSRRLERYTRGYTNWLWSRIMKQFGIWDAGPHGKEDAPGRQGRMPGCNLAGYFYGDKPSGSNWSFNRKEDFAECVAMFVGWGKDNALSSHALKRIVRYTNYKNGEKDDFGVVDNWADYARYFYPEGGDYTRTKRWRFVDELVNGRFLT